jgi:hypothetical protein
MIVELSKYYVAFSWGGLRENTNNFIQDSLHHSRDSNRTPPEYEFRVLPLCQPPRSRPQEITRLTILPKKLLTVLELPRNMIHRESEEKYVFHWQRSPQKSLHISNFSLSGSMEFLCIETSKFCGTKSRACIYQSQVPVWSVNMCIFSSVGTAARLWAGQ